MTHTYQISGMTCKSCVAKVKSELLKMPEVLSAEIQLADPQASITLQRHVGVQAFQEAITRAGNFRISAADDHMPEAQPADAGETSYSPVILIFAYLTGTTLLIQLAQPRVDFLQWMSHFMGGFFLVFSFFKLMNLRGFAEGYQSYDILARAVPRYAFVYPFIELALAIAFIVGFQPLWTNAFTALLMIVSSIGVIQTLMKKRAIACACLGTVIRLPLSKLTLVEDVLMAAMSAVMILMHTI